MPSCPLWRHCDEELTSEELTSEELTSDNLACENFRNKQWAGIWQKGPNEDSYQSESFVWHQRFCGQFQLEQLERLRSEDTPRRLMITHTIESYWIPSQKKTKSKLQI